MAKVYELRVRIADYAPVKAVLDAADRVCEAEGSAPWELTQAIQALRESLDELTSQHTPPPENLGPPIWDNGEEW